MGQPEYDTTERADHSYSSASRLTVKDQPCYDAPMREWLWICIAGGIGGLGATLFAERQELAAAARRVWRLSDWRAWTFHHCRRCIFALAGAFVNICGGATAAFILWATYTSSLTFNSRNVTPSELAAAISVGLGGVGAVRGLMTVSQRAVEFQSLAKESMSELVSKEEQQDAFDSVASRQS